MGKHYYCEICDKTFSANKANISNHLKGSNHITEKNNYYEQLLKQTDPEKVLLEDSGKNPCFVFNRTGVCHRKDTCMFSHLTDYDRQFLFNQISANYRNELRKLKRFETTNPKEDALIVEEMLSLNNNFENKQLYTECNLFAIINNINSVDWCV